MGDLFLRFNPQTGGWFGVPLNWVAVACVILFIPQGYWLVGRQFRRVFRGVAQAFLGELRALLGPLARPGTSLVFLSLLVFIVLVNFLGLLPYVFTPSRHLRFTLRLSLPLWLGSILIRFIVQFNHNIAHLVPSGTPVPLIPVMVIIETVRVVIRPGTLAVRLAANIVAGHLLLVLLGGQGPLCRGAPLAGLILGLVLLCTLECAVSCIQGYVFSVLRSLYLRDHRRATVARLGK